MILSIHRIDGGLELGHGLKGDEEEEEGEGDEENILVDQHPLPPLLLLLLLRWLVVTGLPHTGQVLAVKMDVVNDETF